jgi:sortase A
MARSPTIGPDNLLRRLARFAEAICWVLAIALITPQLLVVGARAGAVPYGPDDSWSAARRAEFERFSRGIVPEPEGHLYLDEQQLRVPIYSGTDELALTLGAGHLPETAPLNGAGNTAIAGHRDGFFRALRHVEVGDRLSIETKNETQTYRIAESWIVAPEEVWVLDSTAEPSVTLITCYPFYHVGSAPERFVVRAVRVESSEADDAGVAVTSRN